MKFSFSNCLLLLITSILFTTCRTKHLSIKECKAILSDPIQFHKSLDHLTDIIVHDIFSPPVSSRVYVYPCIAAYETLAKGHNSYNSLASQLHGLTEIPSPKDTSELFYELAAIQAFMNVGQALVFSEDKMENFRQDYFRTLDSLGLNSNLREKSIRYGNTVAEHIKQWADKDNYKESRSFSKHSISYSDNEWKPTPPSYMEGIEPHWREIRSMVLSSPDQFSPKLPTPFSLKKTSQFYKETMDVYNSVKNANQEQKAIASFWDCNPYVVNQKGHIMYATKKITPGGHWMGITSIASKKSNLELMGSVEAATLVSIALFDGFISCWDEKYRSNLIRPETVINEYIDENWSPILQTPPFPEHTSGHSVISTAASYVLTDLFGESFSYTDDSELKYGLPSRTFTSFIQASEEAAISRLYGGIHFMPAISEGIKQGKLVGELIITQVSTQ